MLRFLALAALVGSVVSNPTARVTIEPRQQGSRQFPPVLQIPDAAHTPQEWMDALNAAIAAGKIPNIPQSIVNPDGSQYYPHGGQDAATCSWTVTKCLPDTDITSAPDNHIAVAFDDGPTNASPALYDFLAQHNQSATHFMIGSNIIENQGAFQHAVQNGNQHFAVHTWSHHLMTSLSNQQVVAELGWTMQAIADYSGGYVPRFWRPPQGDIDNRVRAIAEQVFGLKDVLWNHDTNDWCLNSDGTGECAGITHDSVMQSLEPWITGPKSPGVLMLEHELSRATVQVFEDYYPRLDGLGWTPANVADLYGEEWYKNAANNAAKPDSRGILGPYQQAVAAPSNTTLPTSSTVSTAASSTASASTTKAASQTSSHASGLSTSASRNQHAAQPTSKPSAAAQTNGAGSSTGHLSVAGLAIVAVAFALLV